MNARLVSRDPKIRSEVSERAQNGYLSSGNLAKLLKQSLGLPDPARPTNGGERCEVSS